LRWVQSKHCPKIVTGFFIIAVRPKFPIDCDSLLKGNDITGDRVTQFKKFGINMKVNLMVQTQKLDEEIHQSDSFLMPAFTGEEAWSV
jgi:hypothetical protein